MRLESAAVVNLATGIYLKGQERLIKGLHQHSVADNLMWSAKYPEGCPTHEQVPFAFKAFAMKDAANVRYQTLLWCDASIVPIKSFTPLFREIQDKGYMVMRNGFSNAEWTAISAYKYLGVTPSENEKIEHVVGGFFGLSMEHRIGRDFLDYLFELAKTPAFVGPTVIRSGTRASRGDMEISGHRHDQTAMSVVAHKLGCELTNPPIWFAYRGGEQPETVAVAQGLYQ